MQALKHNNNKDIEDIKDMLFDLDYQVIQNVLPDTFVVKRLQKFVILWVV